MAEFFPPVIFEIKAHATEAIASFKEVNHELASMEKNGMLAGGSLGKLEKAAKYSRTALLGLAGVFGVIAFTSVEALDKVEKAQANLETAIKNTGVAFETAKPYIDANNYSMMQLGFTTDDVYGALAKMTAASGSPKMALESLGVAADLARFKNISLAEAGTLIAKSSIGMARGLADLGLAINKTIPKGADLQTILKLIEDRVHGAAEAFGGTLAGKIAIAKANFQDLQIKIGTDLVPVLIKFTKWLTDHGIPALEKMYKWVKDNTGIVKGLVEVLAALWVAPKIAGMINALATLAAGFSGVATAATEAAAAETAAFAITVPEAFLAFLGAWGAYQTVKSAPAVGKSVVSGVQNMGIEGSLGGVPMGGSSVAPATKMVTLINPNEKNPLYNKISVPENEVKKYLAKGYIISPTNNSAIGGGLSTSSSTPSAINSNKIPSSLTGHPVKTITTPKKVTTPAAKQTTVIQNITVNASNTNDISKKMARAAKTGIPIGGK